ncbi:hypothetical protein J7438_07835 [Thalassotalea sp. G20_0]|uniref:hypothetical protein n=1 Tax=Thalassotalea sp. G20_0 TaxID=2821093 RepID=UPI001ADB0E71|nr:hypothetical protein [Thalassotalea sp. G20_0]MBO9493997.1 hypothetical protein [Thalassotalea sp. G20_0]
MLKIGSIRDTPSSPRTPDEEPAKKAIKKEIPDSDDQHSRKTGLVERTIASISGSSSESDSSSTITESSSESDTPPTITESSLGDSFLTVTGSSSESSLSSPSSSSMSEGTTFRVSNMPIDVLSQVQLLDRLSYMLSDYPELSSITRIEGIPTRSEFNTIYAKLLIQLHYENMGHDSAKIFSLIEPICKGIFEKLK